MHLNTRRPAPTPWEALRLRVFIVKYNEHEQVSSIYLSEMVARTRFQCKTKYFCTSFVHTALEPPSAVWGLALGSFRNVQERLGMSRNV